MFITPSFKKSLIVEQFQGNYLKNCQAIQKSRLDRKSNAWFTLGSESESLVWDTSNFFGVDCFENRD